MFVHAAQASHTKTKAHKRRAKLLAEEQPYTHEDSVTAGDKGRTDNGPPSRTKMES